MASNYWAKLWIEMLDDRKTATLPDNIWRRFVECILIAKELNAGGRLPSIEDIAWRLRVDIETVEQEFDVMARRGLLDYRADNPLDGYWFIPAFEKRQGRMSAAERMSRMRDTEKKHKYYGGGYAIVTKRNTEEETEEEKEEETDKTPFSANLSAFCESSGIPEIMLTSGDVATIKMWSQAGYTPEEIKNAVELLLEKEYTVSRPASINNTLKIGSSNGKRQPPKKSEKRTVQVENPITGELEEVEVI